MLQCHNCGQVNTQTSNFCRFCGTKFMSHQHQPQNVGNYEFQPPRPYAWKTDEFQISESKARKPLNQVQPLAPPYTQQQPQPLANRQQPGYLAQDYRCPRCGSQHYPRFERKISTAGWIVFAVLLVMFFPLFWIGFLIKEDVRICPVCRLRIN
jgi:RNA polymerase subunit RPABC4/transcription elongation factor Spt4